jgi:hypothetical protein
MAQQTVHKTYKYKLKPTPEQERTLAFVLRRCCELYNAALQERKEAWRKCGVSVTVARQSAQLPEIKAVRPEYRDINAQVLQDVLTRLDRAFQAFFRRLREGRTPGYPRFHSANRYDTFTYKQLGEHGGARVDNGCLMLSKIGRIAALVPPNRRDAQDGHNQPGSGRVVRVFLLCGCAHSTIARNRAGNRDRSWARGIRYPVGWRTHLFARLVSQGRASPENGPTQSLAP